VGRAVGANALLIALSVTVLSVVSLGKIQENLVDGILAEPGRIVSRILGVTHSLGTLSIEEARWGDTPTIRALARYVHECTVPSDKTLVTSFAPDFYFFSGRGFAGGQLLPREDRVFNLQQESVPIVVVNLTRRPSFDSARTPVTSYLEAHYVKVLESTLGDDVMYRILVDGRMTPTGTYEPLALPCYRR
jgi:hypothetical protein